MSQHDFVTDAEQRAKDLGILLDRWYWVRCGPDDEWFPAIYDEYSGWCNGDTWGDFYNQVTDWRLIPLPEELGDR